MDDEVRSDKADSEVDPRHSRVETWDAVIEILGWFVEGFAWLMRWLLAGIVTLLHGG
jgi:hypothetical protein